ncbi:MAG: penicillin-binding protein activator [Patescibacteria group bacterium]
MKKIIPLILFVVLFSGCTISTINELDYVDEIKIGFIGPLSGDMESYGLPIKNSVEMAVNDINDAGGIRKKDIKMFYEDGKCEEDSAREAARKLVYEDKVNAIIGGVCSGETLAAAEITEPAGVVLITPSSSSPVVTLAGDYVFRNTTSDADLEKAMASHISKNYQTIAVISENTEYAQHLHDVFVDEYENNGGAIVVDETFYSYTTDFSDIINEIKKSSAEAVFINPQSETAGGNIIKLASTSKLNLPLFGTNVVAGATALSIAGPTADGVVVIDNPPLDKSNPTAQDFLKRYQQLYGTPTFEFYLGAAYDDVSLLAQAIEEIGLQGENIKNYFYKLKNYSGVIGDYRFDSNGDLVWIQYSLKEIKGGSVVEVN